MLITITGASGSGKSSISEYLCSLEKNIVHLNIDTVGHEVLDLPEIKKIISTKFHLKIENDKINRKELGDLIFNNHQNMKQLSDITWASMEDLIDNFIAKNKNKIIILDWILIPKTKYFNISNINILVQADFNTRMKRATRRDEIDENAFREREQATLDFTRNDFDYIIENYDIKQTRKEVKKIYDESIIPR
ncbi:MAG: dephospho-CoA kinase [Bacilli bacterium]|nr:dephospho-CoA kinase [Bacilli bacterium]